MVNLGAVLAGEKKLNDAIGHYEAALRINPRHADAHYHYGNALRARNELDRAIGQYQEAVNLSPRYAAAHNALGVAFCARNQFEQAIPHHEKADQIEPANTVFRANYAAAHNALGNVFHARNQFDQAIPQYERAIQLEPTNARFRTNLGNSLRLRGRLDEANTRFLEALSIDHENASAHNGLGNILSDKGDPDGAIPHYEKAIRLDPNNPRFHVTLGNTLHSLGRHDAAIRQHEEALRIGPKDSMAQNGLGNGFLGNGKVDRAIDCFERAIKLNEKNASAHNNLGIARLYGQGRTAEAIRHFQRAAEVRPRDAVAQYNVGQGLLASGRLNEAREAVRRALSLSAPGQVYHEVILQTMRQLEQGDRLSALEARLPAILQKKEKPAGAAEALKFAWLCQVRLRFAAAARLYADGFAEDPKPANELAAGYRLNAARCAALAAAGWGLDSPGDAERTRLRGQALEWLRADLAAWHEQVASANAETLAPARRTLTLWLRDFRFFAVRDKEQLARLPETERTAWERLWADTEALRIKARAARAEGRWVAQNLRVLVGLELWLDAARLNAARQARGQAPLKAGDAVETWFDGSGNGRHVGQAVPASRPRLVQVGKDWVVRFDGADDHLRRTGLNRSLEACTIFVVAAPHANPGGFRAFLAANAPGQKDYLTGFTLDLGNDRTARFDFLNVEGCGFVGYPNLLNMPSPFGTLHVLEAVVAPATKLVRLFLDGKFSGERPFAPSPLRLDEITVGARHFNNDGPQQHVRGFLRGDIAEVLIYNRVLSADETKSVRQYLDRKYTRLRQALPVELKLATIAGILGTVGR
jgi:tetratricopeptide (TPR) repeat protein